ncbi:hypothetical protein B0H17DRAFT_212223 [Mycena rosella]|uniref:Uncharacterized protein n=1 Tax=Mycena rosella TaxID=1033263 RepID=A0AAD7DXW4_MYCRO|nr:hypothetical protein B0H17DRAFT_212223 [Mycena rosella]
MQSSRPPGEARRHQQLLKKWCIWMSTLCIIPSSMSLQRDQLEWSWGLEYGTLDEHLQLQLHKFCDPELADLLMDVNFILVPHSDVVWKIYLIASEMPRSRSRTSAEVPYVAQDLYQYESATFEYLVLSMNPSSKIAPRVLLSSIPPHLTISLSVDKIFRRGGYQARFLAIYKSCVQLTTTSPPPGATFTPTVRTFRDLQYIHERWAICCVPAPFRGEEEEELSVYAESSVSEWIEWVVRTPSDIDEPARRLHSHELKQPPVVKIPQRRPDDDDDDDDDSMNGDSHITGVEDPEEFAKASVARGDCEKGRTWLTRVESWAQGAECVDDDGMLVNDGQIEVDSNEGPRVATSLDLTKPDYLSKPKLLSTRKVRPEK